MKMNDDKRKQFIDMMENFARKYGLQHESEYTLMKPQIIKVYFRNPKRGSIREFEVDFDQIRSLTEAASPIMAEVMMYWELGDFSKKPQIKNVIFNDCATIVFWDDDTKTVVKCQDGDVFDPEKGIAMAVTKKYFGNQGNFNNKIKKWLPEEDVVDMMYPDIPVPLTLKFDGKALVEAIRNIGKKKPLEVEEEDK